MFETVPIPVRFVGAPGLALCAALLTCSPARSAGIDWSEAPTGLEQQALADTHFVWRTFRGEAVRVHYMPDSFAARHVVALTRSADAAVRRAREIVGVEHYDRPVDTFFFNTRDELVAFLGVPATGYADWRSSSVFLVCNPTWRAFDTHEITHVLSLNLWGEPLEPVWWIREGLSVYADGRCRDHAVRALAAEYLRRGELPHARDLIHHFQQVGELPGYLGSGSFVGFLYETYGRDAVKQVWQKGGDAIEEVLKTRLDVLDARWRESLRGAGESIPPEEWKTVLDRGCG
jgi:hypothetical protein